MWIDGIIVTIFSIVLHSASCAYNEGSDEEILENFDSTTNASRFDCSVNLNLYNLSAEIAKVNGLQDRSVFNLIPNENLTNVPVTAKITLCKYFNQDVGFISKVLNALTSHQQRIDFLTEIQFAVNYNRNLLALLQTVSQDLIETSMNEENALNLLVRNRLLLLSAPSCFLLKLKDIYKVLLLAYASVPADKTDAFWRLQLPLTKRTWSKILLEQPKNLVVSLIKQQKTFSFFQVLDAINLVELRNLLTTLDDDRTIGPAFFHSIDWNTAQIRTIVDFPFKRLNSSLTAGFYRNSLSRLLPVQIARISSEVTTVVVTHLQNVDRVFLPQALQLFECFRVRSNTEFFAPSLFKIDESNCALTAKLLYSQTNSFFALLFNETLKMKIIKCLDSDKYSLLQAHFVLGRSGLRDVKDYLFNLKGLIAAIPASFYINLVKTSKRDGSLENHFIHVLRYFPLRTSRIAASAALHACKTTMGYSRCIESALESGNGELISMISPLEIWQNRESIWNMLRMKVRSDNEFEQRVVNWPTFVLTQLLRDKELEITYEQLFNETHPIHLIILGLNCEILSRISIVDFLPVFEFYNRQRKLYIKEFPKDLQRCAQRAFLDYLRMKSNARVAFPITDLLQHSDLADIRSIGGYILSTFPANSIMKSKYYRNIVEEIGRLSFPELMLAVSRRRLTSIASEYVGGTVIAEHKNNKILAEHLITLGNLIHFLDESYVRKIDASAFKLLLEAEFIDKRVCAPSAVRKAWADKLMEIFDSPETWDENTFLKTGDMLIVMEASYFKVLNVTACARIADLIKSQYHRFVEWIPRRLPFYKVCCVILPQNEQLLYESSVKRLALFYAASIQQLLDTTRTVVEDSPNLSDRERFVALTNDTSPATASDVLVGDKQTTVDSSRNAVISNQPISERTVSYFTNTIAVSSDYSARVSAKAADDVIGGESQVLMTSTETLEKEDAAVTSTTGAQLRGNRNHDGVVDTATKISTEQIVIFARHSSPKTEAVITPNTKVVNQTDVRFSDVGSSISEPISSSTTFDSDPETNTRTSAVSFVIDPQRVSIAEATSTARTSISTAAGVNTADYKTPTTLSFTPTFTFGANDASAKRSPSNDVVFATDITTTAMLDRQKNKDISPSSSPLPFEKNQSLSVALQELIEIANFLDSSSNATANVIFQSKSRSKRNVERKSDSDKPLSVGCNTLKILDTMSDFILNSSRVYFKEEHFFDCVELLAQMDHLSVEQRKAIWSNVGSDLMDKNLTFVAGKILSAVETTVLDNFTYDVHSPGALELIGSLASVFPLKNRGVRLINKILRDNYNNHNSYTKTNELKKNVPLAVFTRALGKMICDVPNPLFFELLKRNDMLADIWTMSQTLNDCPMECLSRIANVTLKVYGDPLTWEPPIFTMLGPVVAAIPDLHTYSNITRYFSASAFECMRFSSYFLNANRSHHQYKQYLDSISLTSAMLLLEKDCIQIDRCSFASSLAAVELTEDSITSHANISSSLGLLIFILSLKLIKSTAL